MRHLPFSAGSRAPAGAGPDTHRRGAAAAGTGWATGRSASCRTRPTTCAANCPRAPLRCTPVPTDARSPCSSVTAASGPTPPARPACKEAHPRCPSDRGTWHIMAGLPYPVRVAGFGLRRPKCPNPGRSFAGTVEAVGSDVTGFKPGDEVFGICDASFAQYARVRTDKLAPKPAEPLVRSSRGGPAASS
ncbi:alcohol dehydrogenase catalytic domain-containing protein [Streptomyces sp. NPDC006365]|uniref:alcohol dehydrogenase catalytic domain-containing protein n=1 Tax=Streptomyces sp. NPDC006365 TaxID=3364744 RepID=UPI0036B1FA33